MREAKRWTAYAALLAAPIAAGGSLVLASGIASVEAILGLAGAASAAVGAWVARRQNGHTRDDEAPH